MSPMSQGVGSALWAIADDYDELSAQRSDVAIRSPKDLFSMIDDIGLRRALRRGSVFPASRLPRSRPPPKQNGAAVYSDGGLSEF